MASHIALMGQGQRYLEKLKELMEGAEAAITVFKRENRPRFEMLLNQELLLTQEVDAFNDTLRDMGLKAKASHSTKRKNIQLPSQPSGVRFSRSSAKIKQCYQWISKRLSVILTQRLQMLEARLVAGILAIILHFYELCRGTKSQQNSGGASNPEHRSRASRACLQSSAELSTIYLPRRSGAYYLTQGGTRVTRACLHKKKQAVQAWRNGKVSREQSQRIQRESNRKVRDAESRGRAEKRLREAKIRQRRDAEEKRQAVEEWRREKEARMREEREREEAERKQKHEKLLQQTERRQRQKDAVARYKLETSEAAQRRTMKASQERKNDSEDAIRLQERRDRDMEYAKRKRAAVLKAKEKETRRERFLDSYKTSTARRAPKARSDPRRLIGDTAASRAQRLGNDELERLVERRHTQVAHARTVASTGRIARGAKSYGIGMGVKVAGRKVPSWRAGV